MAFGRSLRTRVLTCPRFLRIQVVGTRKDAASASSEALRGKLKPANKRMGGRAVEGTGLENRQGRKSLVGSNPTPSASLTLGDGRRRSQAHRSSLYNSRWLAR